MCTVTFVPRQQGYLLAMNRDEKRSRPTGLPPVKRTLNGQVVLAPSEPGGGTWISVNGSGVTFALINWYSIAAHIRVNLVSRGEVVRVASALDTPDSIAAALATLPLANLKPFRLIGVFPATQQLMQWRWNLRKLASHRHPWRAQQWISSGFDEPKAQRIRGRSFREAREQKSVGSPAWLRRLHSSHSPVKGPFSTCMHRSDAATVSFTEVAVSAKNTTMSHCSGAPCECANQKVVQQLPAV